MKFRTRNLALAALAGATIVPAADAGAASPIVAQESALNPVVEMADRAHDRAAHRHVRLERTNAELKGERPDRTRRELRDWSLAHLREENRDLRRENRKLRRSAAGNGSVTTGAAPAHLQSIASCESGGDPSAVGGGGMYRGKYQFDQQTWASVGGTGDPASAPEAEQDKRAAMLYQQRGAQAWPVCGG
jgi:Transglycosylase-like domain